MIKYKVGELVFIDANIRLMPRVSGYVEILKVGRKYAEILIDGCRYNIDIKSDYIFHATDKKTVVGAAYESELKYMEKCAIVKYAEHIKRSVGIIGYRGFLECSMEELKKIASILKINLD